MKRVRAGLWTMDSDARYVRRLSSVSGSASADAVGNKQKMGSLWQKNDTTLHLATAYSLQPTIWWFAQ